MGVVVVAAPVLVVAVAVSALVPNPSGTLADHVAKPSALVAGTLFTFTCVTPTTAPELVPCTVIVALAVDAPLDGLVIATLGPESVGPENAGTPA